MATIIGFDQGTADTAAKVKKDNQRKASTSSASKHIHVIKQAGPLKQQAFNGLRGVQV